MSNYFYPPEGKPQEVHFRVVGKRPTEEEAKQLTRVVFLKKPRSSREINRIISDFLKFIGFSIFAFVLGFFIMSVSRSGGAGSGKVGFMGIIILLAAGIMVLFAFGSLFRLLSTGRKKDAQSSFSWVWQESILYNDTFKISEKGGFRFGGLEYALDKLERAVPENIDRDAIGKYISQLRESMISAMEKTTAKARSEKLGAEGTPLISIKFKNTVELFSNVSEVNATITYQDILTGQNDKAETEYYITAIINLHVTQVFVKTDKYWYPYDLTPDFR